MDDIFSMIKKSPTQMHFIACARENLIKNGFVEMKENEKWENIPNQFFVIRSDETIIACNIRDFDNGLIFATNLDYPCFKVKPHSGIYKNGTEQLNIQPYGYAMWFTWMDRDLSIAGKILLKDKINKEPITKYIITQSSLCSIPSLAYHLSFMNFSLNIEENFRPIINFIDTESSLNDKQIQSSSLLNCLAKECDCDISDIIDFDLYVISSEQPLRIGINDEIFASQQISSISQAAFAFDAFLNAKPKKGMTMFYGYDHENDMNESFTGFDSNFLKETLNRINVKSSFYQNSLLYGAVRIPAAYTYPGYGVCYRYGLNGECQPRLTDLDNFLSELSKKGIQTQKCFTTYDIRCGIQEISKQLNISAFYFGIPIFSLHSIRESALLSDIISYYNSVKAFFELNQE